MVPRAAHFLCCLPLGFAVKLLLWLHLAQCTFTCAMAMGNIVLSLDDFGYATSTAMQIYSALWALPGIPVVLLALSGAYQGVDIYIRVYLYYLAASCVIDASYIVQLFLLQDACVHLAGASLVKNGRAFACGVAHSLSAGIAVATVLASLYMVYIVWSYCEHLDSSGSAGVISGLLASCEKGPKVTRIPCDQEHGLGVDRGGLNPNYCSIPLPEGMPLGHHPHRPTF
mmetsp:Transcript_91507/g.259113  ORF Transcript_91507/g.259113 Transcript_91507/m.259113 type:complete len:227 (+) Transcript_91507:112-792(+)